MSKHTCPWVVIAIVFSLPICFAQSPTTDPVAAGSGASGQTAAFSIPVPRLIKFSGLIQDAEGTPRTGTVGITFGLYKDQEGGAALWLETQNVSLDAQGRYLVTLGANTKDGAPLDLFTSSEARWLGVQAEGQAEQPRVLLVSVPYALKAADAETLGGKPLSAFVLQNSATTPDAAQASSSASQIKPVAVGTAAPLAAVASGATNFTDTTVDQVVLVQQNGTGTALTARAATGSVILAENTAPAGGTALATAITARSLASSGLSWAIYGLTNSSIGRGVVGWANSPTGTTTGVSGVSISGSGYGVVGSNTATTGAAYGVYGRSDSSSGRGVFGTALSTSGATYGVHGQAASVSGYGVLGEATAVSGVNVGVMGRSTSPAGFGVRGTAPSTGLFAEATGATGTAALLKVPAGGKLLSGQVAGLEKFSVSGAGALTASSATFSGPVTATLFTGNGSGLSNVTAAATATDALNLGGVPAASYEQIANKNAVNGYAGLDATSRIAKVQAPAPAVYTDQANTFTTGAQDFSAAAATLPVKAVSATTVPPACIANKEFTVRTDTPAGQQLFICNATGNGWNLVGDGVAGGVSFAQVSGVAVKGQLPATTVYNDQPNTLNAALSVQGSVTVGGVGNSFAGDGSGLTGTASLLTAGNAVNAATAGNSSSLGGRSATLLSTRGINYLAGCDSCGALAIADSQRNIYANVIGPMTIASVTCFSDSGAPAINIQRDDGTPANILSADLTCSPAGATSTSIVALESVLNAGEKLDFVLTIADGIAKRVTVAIKAVVN